MKGNNLFVYNSEIPEGWEEIDQVEFLASYNGYKNKQDYVGSIFIENKKLKEENKELKEKNKKLTNRLLATKRDVSYYNNLFKDRFKIERR